MLETQYTLRQKPSVGPCGIDKHSLNPNLQQVYIKQRSCTIPKDAHNAASRLFARSLLPLLMCLSRATSILSDHDSRKGLLTGWSRSLNTQHNNERTMFLLSMFTVFEEGRSVNAYGYASFYHSDTTTRHKTARHSKSPSREATLFH